MAMPGLVATAPLAAVFARTFKATDEAVRKGLAALPTLLNRVERLIDDGTIGGEAPNAADLQIASSVRSLLAFSELREVVGGRPAAELALRLFSQMHEPVPPVLPKEWLPPRAPGYRVGEYK